MKKLPAIIAVPLKITGLFLGFGVLWIWVGEWLAARAEGSEISFIQLFKGYAFLVLTALMIFFLVYSQTRRLAKSEDAYRGLFISNPLPLFIFEPKSMQILEANLASIAFFGYATEALTRMKILDLFFESDRERWLENLFREREGPRQEGVFKIRTREGTARTVNIQSFEKRRGSQRIRLAVCYDLTDTVQAQQRLEDANFHLKLANERLGKQERELRALTERFQLACQSAGIGMLEWRPDGHVFEWDQTLCDLMHDPLPPGMRPWSAFGARIAPDDLPAVQAFFIRPGDTNRILLDFRVQIGAQRRWLQIAAAWFTDQQGKPYLLGAAWDISNLKRQQEEIIQSKSNIDALINSTDDLVWSLDRNLRLMYCNRPFAEQVLRPLNLAADQAGTTQVAAFDIEAVGQSPWRTYYERGLNGETVVFEEHGNDPATGAMQVRQIKFFPIRDPEQRVIGISCFSRDVSQLIAQEEQLLKQHQTISEIAWKFAHMLRVPVANSLGLIENFSIDEVQDPFSIQAFRSLRVMQQSLDSMIREMSRELELIIPELEEDPGQSYRDQGPAPSR